MNLRNDRMQILFVFSTKTDDESDVANHTIDGQTEFINYPYLCDIFGIKQLTKIIGEY